VFLNHVSFVPKVPLPVELSRQSNIAFRCDVFPARKLPELPVSTPIPSAPLRLVVLPTMVELMRVVGWAIMPDCFIWKTRL
jgi:hypothetical protein